MEDTSVHQGRKWRGGNNSGMSGGIYVFAFIGAAVYYIMHAESFTDGLLGVLKALVWPAIFAFKFLEGVSGT